MRKVLCVLCLAAVLLVSYGPRIDQDVQLIRVTNDGQCIYQVLGYIWSNGDILYSTCTYDIAYSDIEYAKSDQLDKLRGIIDSGCLAPLL